MWSTIANNFRENLSQIASDVLDTAQELETSGSTPFHHLPNDSSQLTRQREAHLQSQIDWYKREVRRLQGESNIPFKDQEKDTQREDMNHFDVNISNQQLFSDISDAQLNNGRSLIERVNELELQNRNLRDNNLGLDSQIREKDQAYALLKHTHDQSTLEIESLKKVLDKERADFTNADMQLQRERKAKEEAERECQQLKAENYKLLTEIAELKQITHEVTSKEISFNYLQKDIRENLEEGLIVNNEKMEGLQESIRMLKREKSELQVQLKNLAYSQVKHLTSPKSERKADVSEVTETSTHEQEITVLLRESEDVKESQLNELKGKLESMRAERDKALRDVSRLREHLLEKEQADSEKMDRDNEHIVELQALVDASSARTLQLQQALAEALAKQDDLSKWSSESLQKTNEEILLLRERLSSCVATLESKNVEILNLQTVLGQYYAESEAKERLLGELLAAKKEIAFVSENLKTANLTNELHMKERDELLVRLSYQENKNKECQQKMNKLEEETIKLRKALEQSITRLNRMSSESDYLVDRRIVIKLLVTYFQRQHSREVLDLMVRMLGFSEEDKKAIGLAHQAAGKGVVRGMLGFPGRVVGGLLKTASSEPLHPTIPIENQSFADLWIDFLLKESEERERKTAEQKATQENGEWSSLHV